MWAAAGREAWSIVLQASVREQLLPCDLGFRGSQGVASSCKKDSGERALGMGECVPAGGQRVRDAAVPQILAQPHHAGASWHVQ